MNQVTQNNMMIKINYYCSSVVQTLILDFFLLEQYHDFFVIAELFTHVG